MQTRLTRDLVAIAAPLLIVLAVGCSETPTPTSDVAPRGSAATDLHSTPAPVEPKGPATAAVETTAVPATGSSSQFEPVEVPTTEVARTGEAPPDWLGSRLLPLRSDEHGVPQPTPPELTDRRLWTTDTLPAPTTDDFLSEIVHPVPAAVLARSTWHSECPVGADELAYATVSFIGFDGLNHTGELLTNHEWIDELVRVFEAIFAEQFPIEEMRVTTPADVDAHPTGDRNNTGSFVCRPTVTSNGWSQHAYGLAIDINPFHNPFVAGDLIIPALSESYVERDDDRLGMVTDQLVALFDELGWGWGGRWTRSRDWMHFSSTGH